jgi:hypothetical protein
LAVGAITSREFPTTQAIVGRSKLTAGAVIVAFPQITDDSLIFAAGNDATVTGIITITRTAGTSFTLTSSVGGDVGFVAWLVVLIP